MNKKIREIMFIILFPIAFTIICFFYMIYFPFAWAYFTLKDKYESNCIENTA